MRKEKGNSNGHNSSFGCPFDAILFLNPRIFSISTQPVYRNAVCACRFSQKCLLLNFSYVSKYGEKIKKEIQSKRMSFSNRSRRNTRIQKKDCVKRTFESKVTIIWKFSILKIEGSCGFGKLQTAITRASGVRFMRFFFWTRVFFRYLRNQTTVRWFERAYFSKNALYPFLE